jgi:hypothetical protein
MDFAGVRTVDVIRALPWQPAPWVVVSALIGLICASSFFVLAGRGSRSLPTYLILGLLAGPLSHLATARLPHPIPGLMIGELDLLLVAAGAWGFLLIARLLHL